jgi:dihydrofolate reductase
VNYLALQIAISRLRLSVMPHQKRENCMGNVVFNMTMSLDGFVAGPNDSPENGLGDGGDRLFNWYFSGTTEVPISDGKMVLKVSPQSAKVLHEAFGTTGAGVCGRKTFDIAHAWGGHPPISPSFIVTHTAPQEWVKKGSPFTFVTDGVGSAIRQAKQAAGNKDVVVSTPSILQQCLNLGLMDEIHVDIAPVLLGNGVRPFDHLNIKPTELESIRVVGAPDVTHLAFRVVK